MSLLLEPLGARLCLLLGPLRLLRLLGLLGVLRWFCYVRWRAVLSVVFVLYVLYVLFVLFTAHCAGFVQAACRRKKKSPYLTPWSERSGDFRRGLLRVAQNSKIPREAEFHNLPPCGSKIRDKPPGGAERRSGGRYGRIGVWQNRKTKLRARSVKNRRRSCRPGRGRPRTVCASGCM